MYLLPPRFPFFADELLFGREGACFCCKEVFGIALFDVGADDGGGMAILSDRKVELVVVVEARLDNSLLQDLFGERPR